MRSIHRFTCWTCAGIFAVLSVLRGASAQTTTAPDTLATLLQHHGYREVPLTPYEDQSGQGLYTVQVTIGAQPVTLLFDSGFNGDLVLTRSKAQVLGIRGTPYRKAEAAAGASVTDTTHLTQFTIGTMQFGPQFVSVGRFPTAEGGIGARFMSAHNAVLDYPHDALYLQVQPDSTVSADALKRPGDVVIPLTRMEDKRYPAKAIYLLHAEVEGKAVTLLLDTGWGTNTPGPLFDQARADALGLSGRSAGRVTLGTLQLDAVPLATFDLSGIEKRLQGDGFPKIDGILGAAIPKNHDAIVDFAHQVLYLRSK